LPHEVPKLPWQKVGLDIFFHEGKQFLLVVDYLSKYIEMIMLSNMSSPCVVNSLKAVFSRHGIPMTVITANDTCFISQTFKEFSESWEFNHVVTSPHFSQSNGMVERAIQNVKNLIKKSLYEKTDLYLALLEYRNTPIAHNIPSPAEILYSRKLNGLLPYNEKQLSPKVNKHVRYNLKIRQDIQKTYYDRKTKSLRPLMKHEIVLMKHKNKWIKSKIVEKRNVPRSYVVQNECGKNYVRNRYHLRPFRAVRFYDEVGLDESNKSNSAKSPVKHASQSGTRVSPAIRVSPPPKHVSPLRPNQQTSPVGRPKTPNIHTNHDTNS
jgi:transposase InsO family protein